MDNEPTYSGLLLSRARTSRALLTAGRDSSPWRGQLSNGLALKNGHLNRVTRHR